MQLDEHKGLRRLAAEVIRMAVEDYKRPRRCAREVRAPGREVRNECAKFLVSNSYWHMILGLHPDMAARWLRKQVEGTKRWD